MALGRRSNLTSLHHMLRVLCQLQNGKAVAKPTARIVSCDDETRGLTRVWGGLGLCRSASVIVVSYVVREPFMLST